MNLDPCSIECFIGKTIKTISNDGKSVDINFTDDTYGNFNINYPANTKDVIDKYESDLESHRLFIGGFYYDNKQL